MRTTHLNEQRLTGVHFGPLLRRWRERKGLSQLSLSLASGVSQRHVSFLESGRAKPSRDMILRLAAELDIPLRHRNELLLAAGFAPAYSESNWTSPDIAPVRRAVELIMAQQEPYPAVVLDRLWNVQLANAGAAALFAFLSPERPVTNLLTAVFDPRCLRPAIENWDALAAYLRWRIRQELDVLGTAEAFNQLVQELRTLDQASPSSHDAFPEVSDPVLWVSLRKGPFHVRLFSIITTLGTPHDITLQELRVESFFPADDISATQLQSLARPKDPRH